MDDQKRTGEHKLLDMREDEPKKRGLSKNAKKEIREWVVALLTALVLVVLIRTFLFTVIRVDGESMLDTLHDGDRLIVTILDKKISGAHRGDVVICHYPDRTERFVKRVVAIGGDTVEVKDTQLYVNGEAVEEPYLTRPQRGNYGPITVPEGEYFVMGDNRGNSNDSTASHVGTLDEDMVLGIARLIMWPPSDIGVIPGGGSSES